MFRYLFSVQTPVRFPVGLRAETVPILGLGRIGLQPSVFCNGATVFISAVTGVGSVTTGGETISAKSLVLVIGFNGNLNLRMASGAGCFVSRDTGTYLQ